MTGPLSYPPEIQIESCVELPPEFGQDGISEVWFELIGLLIELVIELPFSL
jgi:hypothetical protein